MNNTLEHLGILGMHWRKHNSTQKSPNAKDFSESRKLMTKSSKNLSNEQLTHLTKRLQLETQYSQLNPSSFSKAHNMVKNILTVGTTLSAVYAFTKTPMFTELSTIIRR